MSIKKSIVLFVAAVVAVSFVPAPLVQATVKPDFLYKFGSFWSDVATDGTNVYVTNSSYSQIDKYQINPAPPITGTHISSNWGGYGTALGKLKQPMGIAWGQTNLKLYVVDTGNNRVERFDSSTGVADFAWGSYGTTVGAGSAYFNAPQGVAVNSAETLLFVADTGNNRIQAITLTGGSVASAAGTLGMGLNQFSSPKGIAVTGAGPYTVYVADTGNNRVVEYTFTAGVTNQFTYVRTIAKDISGVNYFNQPNKIAIDGSGNIFVTDTTNKVQKFNSSGAFLLSQTVYSGQGTTGLAINGVALSVIEPYHQIDLYDTTTLTYSSYFSDESNEPTDIAVDSSNNIYINNITTNTVQKFNSSWIPTAEWGGNGTSFSNSLGIGVNSGRGVCVADSGNNRLQRFDTGGNYLSTLPTPMVTPAGFSSPGGVGLDTIGGTYVVDSANNRVLRYQTDQATQAIRPDWAIGLPTPIPTITIGVLTPTPAAPTGPYFLNPRGIAVDSQNSIYVADSGYNRIQKFNGNGTIMQSWGQLGSADVLPEPQFDNPQGVAIQETGVLGTYYLYVADTNHNRIQRFTQSGVRTPSTDIWGGSGKLDSQFIFPKKIALDSSNRIYVSENGMNSSGEKNNRIQVFGDAAPYVSASVHPYGAAGLTIVGSDGVNVTEDGSVIGSYTVRLKSQPSASVTVSISSSDPKQLAVSSPLLTFTQYNWNIPQVVTVIPVADYIAQTITQQLVLTNTTLSADTNYNGITTTPITVTLTDTDHPGFTVDKTSFTAAETTATTVTYKLTTKPSAAFTLNIVTDAQLTALPTSIQFTQTNWNTDNNIVFTAVQDNIVNAAPRLSTISGTLASAPTEYTGLTPSLVTASITDVDVAGLTIAGITGSAMSLNETGAGSSKTYTVKLKSKPAAAVQIDIQDASSSAHVTLSPSTLNFDQTNWNTTQTVTATAVHDYLANPPGFSPPITTITYSAANSTDTVYKALDLSSYAIATTIVNTDTTGLLIFKPGGGGVHVTEGGASDDYAFQLTSIPASDVTVGVAPIDGQTTVVQSSYTFTPANWNVAQYATVSAVDDTIAQGTHYGQIIHTLTSADSKFNGSGKEAYQLVTITDNDIPGITITLPNGAINIVEGGPSDSYFIHLGTQPVSNVTLLFDAQGQATSSANAAADPYKVNLQFTPANWNINQEVVITAIQNYIVQGPHTATVSYTGISADPIYNGRTASFVANIADDDSVSPGIAVVESNGNTSVTKDITTDTYTLALTSKPSANVKIKIVSSGPEATTSAGIFWFGPSTWNVPQTVTVLAKSNPGGGATNIFYHIVTSLDQHYNGIGAPSVNVTINENKATSPSAANAKPPTCNQTPPYSAPTLFQVSTMQNQATLYFTPINDNISYYFVAYGFAPGDMRFGTSFQMGPYAGVINFTVNMLDAGTTYYFTVRGGNGCATGPWSAAVPATTVRADGSTTGTYTYYAPVSAASSSPSSGSTGGSSPTGGIWLTRDLYPGSVGADVRSLQEYLNSKGFTLASSGAGSPGNETTTYGNRTAAAVRRFQEAHFAEILSPLGYASGTGICGSSTRNYINSHP